MESTKQGTHESTKTEVVSQGSWEVWWERKLMLFMLEKWEPNEKAAALGGKGWAAPILFYYFVNFEYHPGFQQP